jgi:hypothetical protein
VQPDVADGVERGEVASGREHFLSKGHFQGRAGAVPVQGAWYLSHSPNVAHAKRAAQRRSGEAHYRKIGVREWREPNPGSASAVMSWKGLMSRIGDIETLSYCMRRGWNSPSNL